MATARHVENPGPLTVLQVLSMTVEELRYELQARNLTPSGTAKPDLQQTFLAVVPPLPPDQPSPVLTAPGNAVGLGARPRTSSGQPNSASDLQLQSVDWSWRLRRRSGRMNWRLPNVRRGWS